MQIFRLGFLYLNFRYYTSGYNAFSELISNKHQISGWWKSLIKNINLLLPFKITIIIKNKNAYAISRKRAHLASLNLNIGDWISNVMEITLNPGYRHHSIYVGDDMVVGRVQRGVVYEGIWLLARIKTVKVVRRGGFEEALTALKMVGNSGYSLLFKNCEQFCEKC